MKDWYLRFILTVIAACLVFQVGDRLMAEPALASSSNVMDVRIIGLEIETGSFKEPSLPVKIVGIEKPRVNWNQYNRWDNLPVEITEAD